MDDEPNCTQFTEPFQYPYTDKAGTIPAVVIFIVTAYRPYHYYVLTFLIAFSVIANILILVVLSEKEMRSVGVNVTMMLMAFCDFVCGSTAVAQLFMRNYVE
uniref:Uncharacterized protein n=1 Tax=Caenorhabditis japonica TaxID=281687 RepID=A0A8R1DYV1_CAEJA